MRKLVLGISLLMFLTVFATQVFAADQVYFYHTDPAGTPLAMTDSSGTVVWKADYKPFGEENSTSGAAENDRRFVGKEKDEETGLSYFGARYEDAKVGRFIAPDPVRAVDPTSSRTNEKLLLNPQRLNTYTYSLNNPNRYVDPDGNHPVLIGLGIIWLGEMVMPQTMGSSQSDSFIGRHWSDLLLLPLGIERETATVSANIAAITFKAESLNISMHAMERMGERGISEAMVKKALEKGTKFWDPKNKVVNYVLDKGFGSGKSLLVGQNPETGMITTVIRGKNLISPRFIPLD